MDKELLESEARMDKELLESETSTLRKIPVIVEKIIESDVPDIDKNMSVQAEISFGQFVSILHERINLIAHKEIFVFVKNTLTPTEALMSEIYEEHKDENGFLCITYSGEDILCSAKTSLCLADSIMHEHPRGARIFESLPDTWMPLLSTLEKLVSISESNEELKKRFEEILKRWKEAFCSLLACLSTEDDIPWVMKLKEFTNFDVRNHLLQILFPTLELQHDQLQVVVSRENLFQDSLNHVMAAQKSDFLAGINVKFADEEAEGDGVLREWLFLVCKFLFDPKNKLFIPSPDDPRRFAPHPKPLMEQNYLQKYRFAGRIISLALMHNVQVGILLDPLFFHQLAGKIFFSLQDLIQTDLVLHKQYMDILEKDAQELVGYGLNFADLCYNGENKQVTSENRDEYIHLKVMERYFHQIRDQSLEFSFGVEDMIEEGNKAEIFFSLLKLDDLDSLLRGSQDDDINVDEWLQSTDYITYQANDNVIIWFWEFVKQLNQEDLHKLLCFWTSHRFLPKDGFHGLPRFSISRIYITNGAERDYKPRSQTCCYNLQLPAYITCEDTEKAVNFIIKEYVMSGFGEA